MLVKIMEYPEKIQILSIIFMKIYPLKNGGKQILRPTS